MNKAYRDYIPGNARIIIDYKKDEKVRFSYPIEWTYWKAVWERAVHTFFSFFRILSIPILVVAFLIYKIRFDTFVVNPSGTITYVRLGYFIIYGYVVYMVWLYVLPLLVCYVLALDKELFSRVLPRLSVFVTKVGSRAKFVEFIPSDVEDNKVMIPSFSNVFLDYKATEDFSRYFDRLEILELPFSFYKSKRRKVRNDFFFSAVFYFSKKPKTGSLEVKFS